MEKENRRWFTISESIIECENDIKIANEIMLKLYKQIWKNVLHVTFKVLIKQNIESNTGLNIHNSNDFWQTGLL